MNSYLIEWVIINIITIYFDVQVVAGLARGNLCRPTQCPGDAALSFWEHSFTLRQKQTNKKHIAGSFVVSLAQI